MDIPVLKDKNATDAALLPLSEAASLIAAGKLSSVELTQACLRRIDKYDGQVNAFITVTSELALKQAAHADREIAAGRYRGPMHGVPFALKDIIDTSGVLTTAHSRILDSNIPQRDATAVARLYAAGGVLLGKLSTHEFAHGGPSFDLPWPPARNPWNTEHFSGGSSSGSGAAVAAGFVPAALGTDTGGSIRQPASMCGIVGLKPTYGRVSRHGVINNSFTFDNCGPLTWTAQDCAILLQAIAGHDPLDPSSSREPMPDYRAGLTTDLNGLRVGVMRHFWEEDLPVDEELAVAMEKALEVLRGLGAKLEVARMRPIQEYFDVKIVIAESELFSIHEHDLIDRPQDFGAIFLGRVLAASLFSAADYVQAQRERLRLLSDMESLYEQHDVLVSVAPGPAPRLDAHRTIGLWEKWKKPNLTTPFSITGGPALAQCIGFSRLGMPLSMQIAARPFNEQAVFRAAHAYEEATPWRNRRPQLTEGAKAQPIAIAAEATPVETPNVDVETQQIVRVLVQRAGLKLDDRVLTQLYGIAPYALAMAKRIHRKRERSEEPANVFRFPGMA